MKRFISFVMSLGMAFMLWGVPIEVSAASSGDCGNGVTWTYDEAGKTLTISGNGAMNDFEGFSDRPWDSLGSSIENVVVDNGVTNIGKHAFGYFYNLKSVSIPNSVTSIGGNAFYRCEALEGISIPSSVTNIGSDAFCNCKSLKSINIPNGVTSIGSGAFSSCKALTRVVIPDSVTSIGNGLFGFCSALTDVTISNSITKIDSITFYGCTSLENIAIPNSVTMIGESAFVSCTSLTSITIPDNVTSIGESAFERCTNLTAVYAPNGLNIDSAEIPETSLKIKYTVTDGKATITEIIPAAGNTTVVIPEAINGYEVTAVAGEAQEKVDKTAHTVHKGGSATCIAQAVCGICGEPYGSLGEHNYSEDWSHDENEHWHECTVCGDKTDTDAHSCGEDWLHDENEHWHECTVCGGKTDTDAHSWDEDWLHDESGHWHECECGEKADQAPHTEDTGTVTVQPTETAAGTKVFKCTECGYEMRTETVPPIGVKPTPTPAPPPSSSSSPSPSPTPTPAVSPAKPDKTPYIEGNNGKSGWQSISEEISEVRPGGTVTIEMNGTTELPKDITEDIAGKDVDLVLDMGGGISWTINGLTVTDPKTVDMSVTKNTKKIPADIINNVSGERYTMQISLAHDGVLGLTATLNIGLGRKNNGLYANLFYYDRAADSLDFVDCGVIKNGTASIDFTHASDYAIVVDKEPLGVLDDVSAAAGYVSEDGILSADDTIYYGYVCTVFPIIAGLAAMLFIKRRQK